MRLRTTLHRISHLKWVFLVVEIALIGYCFLGDPPDLLSVIGLTIFVAGIYLGLDSLSDQERMSDTAMVRYRDDRYALRQAQILMAMIVVLACISTLFLSLRWFASERNEELFRTFFDVGLDCLALILGMLCALKSVRDHQEFARAKMPAGQPVPRESEPDA